MKRKLSPPSLFSRVVAGVTLTLLSAVAMAGAAKGFGDMAGGTWTEQSTGLIKFAEVAAILAGIVMVIIGLVKFANTQQGQPRGPAIILIVTGGALASIVAVMAFGSNTISGDSRGQDKLNDLVGANAIEFRLSPDAMPAQPVLKSVRAVSAIA